MKIETYQEQKKRHSDEFGNFKGLFFAFSNEQLKEGMTKIGLTMNDVKLICSIGLGGYIKKDELADFRAMLKQHKIERKNRLKDEKNLISALAYELSNHEYCITYDPTDALNALDLSIKDISPELLKKAINESRKVEIK